MNILTEKNQTRTTRKTLKNQKNQCVASKKSLSVFNVNAEKRRRSKLNAKKIVEEKTNNKKRLAILIPGVRRFKSKSNKYAEAATQASTNSTEKELKKI
ncbi:MAG: hypothetical protein NZ889_00065 [Candidatus Pacearchaeota archaeon]|nr:hypothetical protein [Candidatus Pacearchaeota archaeon]